MKSVIVSGATGSIGMAFIKKCINENIEMLILCRKDSLRTAYIPKNPLITLMYSKLEDFKDIQNINNKQYDVFYHFAWEGTIGNDRNDMYLQNMNIRNTLDAVKLARRFGCHTFIGAGSQAEYGRVDGKLSAKTPVFPENGYGIAKLCAGLMTRELCSYIGMKHIWVRVLSVYGPYDDENTMVISTIKKLINQEVPRLTSGEQVWDYLYSSDAARAFYLLGQKGLSGKTYVLGSGYARPLKEYIYEIRNAIDANLKVDIGAIPYSSKQVMYLCADIDELTIDTGFKPSTAFGMGVKMVIDFIRGLYNVADML